MMSCPADLMYLVLSVLLFGRGGFDGRYILLQGDVITPFGVLKLVEYG
mgnify:CR=1 FL=1